MKYLTIKVTQEDINRGVHNDPWSCPISTAAARALDQNFVTATPRGIKIGVGRNQPVQVRLSKRARQFMFRFDSYKPVEPATFRLQDLR